MMIIHNHERIKKVTAGFLIIYLKNKMINKIPSLNSD